MIGHGIRIKTSSGSHFSELIVLNYRYEERWVT